LEETRVPGENNRPAAGHWQILQHNVVSNSLRLSGIRTSNVSGDNTDCIDSCKCKCTTITITTVPYSISEHNN
jgi:hypothetical protein